MKPSTTIVRAAALLLCSAVFAGTAFAGDKPKDEAPGNSGNAPGQQKKADDAQAAAQTPPGQAKKAEKQAAKADTKAAKADERPARRSGSFKATSRGSDLKRGMDHKHTICHATGSATNPFVVITPSVSGVFNGHMGHQGGEDIIPPFTYKGRTYSQNWDADGEALFANGCEAVVAAQTTTAATTTNETTTTTTTQECPPTTRTITEVVEGGVFHKTGSATHPYVFIRPAKNSAHYTKHADDIVVEDETVTRTIAVAGSCDEAATTGGETTVTLSNETVTLAGTTATVAGSTVTVLGQTVTVGGEAAVETTETTEAAGGVLGAQSPPPAGGDAGEEAGGVLDAVASIGETAVTGTLPFTGIPLWLAALAGGGLLAAGFALRRTT